MDRDRWTDGQTDCITNRQMVVDGGFCLHTPAEGQACQGAVVPGCKCGEQRECPGHHEPHESSLGEASLRSPERALLLSLLGLPCPCAPSQAGTSQRLALSSQQIPLHPAAWTWSSG